MRCKGGAGPVRCMPKDGAEIVWIRACVRVGCKATEDEAERSCVRRGSISRCFAGVTAVFCGWLYV